MKNIRSKHRCIEPTASFNWARAAELACKQLYANFGLAPCKIKPSSTSAWLIITIALYKINCWLSIFICRPPYFLLLYSYHLLPFLSYRERPTFFRIFSHIKHSSLPRQTVAFFNWTDNAWSVNMSNCVLLHMKHGFWKLVTTRGKKCKKNSNE